MLKEQGIEAVLSSSAAYPAAYKRALESLQGALKFGINPSLEGMCLLCSYLGHPEEKFKIIQVAGTNGKSSCSRFIAALMQAQGYKTGLYTSPELVEYRERMEIEGTVVSYDDFALAIETVLKCAQEHGLCPTEFEILTAAALWLFAEKACDLAVLEVGLGGRWDATSVRAPELAVITGIAFDHMAILGSSLPEIAAEKAAIIHPKTEVCLAAQIYEEPEVFAVFDKRCKDCNVAPYWALKDGRGLEDLATLTSKLLDARPFAAYQEANLLLSLLASQVFIKHYAPCKDISGLSGLDLELAYSSLLSINIPGRYDRLRQKPLVLLDAAHNPQSVAAFIDALKKEFGFNPQDLPAFVFAVFADKDVDAMIDLVLSAAQKIVLTQTKHPRALAVAELKEKVLNSRAYRAGFHELECFEDVASVLGAFVDKDFVACGSITLAGEITQQLRSSVVQCYK